jgi:uncharacterized membrane protein
LGDPTTLSKQIRASAKVKKAETSYSAGNIIRAVLATAGLGLFNIIFIAGPFFGLIGALIGLYAAAVSVFAAGILGIISGLVFWANPHFLDQCVSMGIHPVAALLLGISCACFGILFVIACGYLTKWFYIGTLKYLKMNLKVITGDKE